MIQGSLNPNITFLGEKLWPVVWNKKLLPLDHGGPEKKFTYFQHNCPKNGKMTPLTGKGLFDSKVLNFLWYKVLSTQILHSYVEKLAGSLKSKMY